MAMVLRFILVPLVIRSTIVTSVLSEFEDHAGTASGLSLLQQHVHGSSAHEHTHPTLASSMVGGRSKSSNKPNVLFIICDDLTTDVEGIAGAHPQTQTPNIKALIESGSSFSHSYTSHPICNPSRTSILTGIIGSNSGLMTNPARMADYEAFNHSLTLPQYFKKNGYHVLGTGKVFHENASDHFDEYGYLSDLGPVAVNKSGIEVNHPSAPEPLRSAQLSYISAPLSDVPYNGSKQAGWYYKEGGDLTTELDYKSWHNRDLTPDERNAAWTANKIRTLSSQQVLLASRNEAHEPFFLAVGFVRPHTPHYVPDKFFDKFPLNEVQLPSYKENDLNDTTFVAKPENIMFNTSVESYGGNKTLAMQHFVQGYLAAIASVDEQIGIVMEALNNSGVKNNTIVVFTSDHGFHAGSKDALGKDTVWESSLRVPLVFRAPGVTTENSKPHHPVTTLNIYPTLKDLCNLNGWTNTSTKGHTLDGYSLKPFLKDASQQNWIGPSAAISEIMTYGEMRYTREETGEFNAYSYHLSVATEDMHYIHLHDGGEELYNHTEDPYEWTNLVNYSSQKSTKKRLKEMLVDYINMHGDADSP